MADNSTYELLNFKITNFNRVAATLGGFLSLFGLISFLLKEEFYLSEPRESLTQFTSLLGFIWLM